MSCVFPSQRRHTCPQVQAGPGFSEGSAGLTRKPPQTCDSVWSLRSQLTPAWESGFPGLGFPVWAQQPREDGTSW